MVIMLIIYLVRQYAPTLASRTSSVNLGGAWNKTMGFMGTKAGKVTFTVMIYLLGFGILLGMLSRTSLWDRMSSNGFFWLGILAIVIAVILYYVHRKKEPIRTWMIRILLIAGIAGLVYSAFPQAPEYERRITSNTVDGTYTLAPKTTMEIHTPLAGDSFMLTPTKGDVWIAQVGRPTHLLKSGVTAVFGPKDVANAHSDDPQRDAAQIVVMSYKYKKIGECD